MDDLKPQSSWLSNRLVSYRGNIRIIHIIYKVNSTVEKRRARPSFESRKLKLKGADARKQQNSIF